MTTMSCSPVRAYLFQFPFDAVNKNVGYVKRLLKCLNKSQISEMRQITRKEIGPTPLFILKSLKRDSGVIHRRF